MVTIGKDMKIVAPKKILVVDDEEEMRVALKEALARAGHTVETAVDGFEAVEFFGRSPVELVIADIRMPKMGGLDLLRELRKNSKTPFVMITAYGSSEEAENAMTLGASDFLQKPFSADQLDSVINRIFESGKEIGLPADGTALAVNGGRARGRGRREIVTENKKLLSALDIARRVAPSKSSVLLHGESGTGKELFARFIHDNSDRHNRPFVAVNCAALPEALLESELFGHEKGAFTGAVGKRIGKFEMADKGTILLDEITEMSPPLQAKLLRVLQEHEIDRVGGSDPVSLDIRVIATTNRDIEDVVEKGDFREDLYFRLNVIPIFLPPLRERGSDIEVLARFFMMRFNAVMGKAVTSFSDSAKNELLAHPFRGNIRELENVMERAVLLCRGDTIEVEDLMLRSVKKQTGSATDNPVIAPGRTVAQMEEELIKSTLDSLGWNRTQAADQLGISIRTLRNKLNEYKVKHKREL